MPTIQSLHTHSHPSRPAASSARPQPAAPQAQAEPRDQVQLSPEARRSTYAVPNESNDFVRDGREDRTPEVRQRQEASVRGALQSGGQPFELHNSAGQRESYTLRAGSSDGSYELRGQDGHTLNVELDERMSQEERVRALASISDFQSRIPAHHRDALDYVTVTNDAYPTDGGTLEGFARRSSMTIYEGNRYLDNGVLDHEFGHVLGHKLVMSELAENSVPGGEGATLGAWLFSSNTPTGWRSAVEGDGNAPSQYARDNGAPEDFAESYVAYREAQEEGPEAIAALRQRYPERVRYLEEVMAPPQSFFSALFEGLRGLHS